MIEIINRKWKKKMKTIWKVLIDFVMVLLDKF